MNNSERGNITQKWVDILNHESELNWCLKDKRRMKKCGLNLNTKKSIILY